MKEFSIYHLDRFGKAATIRFNLAAVRRLLPEYQITGFGLTTRQRTKMQRRVNLYTGLGGKVDLQTGIDATEERRLFYVGVTRAKEQLYLVRAKVRSGRGAARATAPSRFLKFPPLPPGTVETVQYDSQAPLAPQEIAAQARAFREALMALKTPRG